MRITSRNLPVKYEPKSSLMSDTYDLLIIGGGINGTAIARDAAGRGLSVLLCEKDDLANHTSSASTKLIHGGLRYLEYYEFRLVRESLKEREVLLRSAPHIIWPLRFILPYDKGLRPAWLLRLGLFIYDNLGGRKLLPATKTLNLTKNQHKGILKSRLKKGFEYSDCWVQDSRLVVLNAVDAKERGADIRTRTEVLSLNTSNGRYEADIVENGQTRKVTAKAIVNSAGPWVEEVLYKLKRNQNSAGLRLVKGSHIVTKRLYEGDHCYIFQNADDRIIFAIPYEQNYTLIGTTDVSHETGAGPVKITDEEVSYLCNAASEYFTKPIVKEDVIWTYSGVRPLYDDQSENASAVTRDYVFKTEEFTESAPFLSIYGGKITTSRKLAEHAMEKLTPYFEGVTAPWTRDACLPGGDIKDTDFQSFYEEMKTIYPNVPHSVLNHLARAYGTKIHELMELSDSELGEMFGKFLSEAEINYLVQKEWAKSADDILWRRTKLGLHMSQDEQTNFQNWFSKKINHK